MEFYERFGKNVKDFVDASLPYSHWGMNYYDIRLFEFSLIDGLFPGVFSNIKGKVLDVGCGIGLGSVFLSQFSDSVDGIDIDEIGVAFKVDRPAPYLGQEILDNLCVKGVALECCDTLEFLSKNKGYDFIFSSYVLEHVENLENLIEATYKSLSVGGKAIHIVPNTKDTIIQLLIKNLSPIKDNITSAWRNRKIKGRVDTRFQGGMFTPVTHSEFISDYRDQFDVNSIEHYLMPMVKSGFKVLDIKPIREHSYGILIEKT